jgi:undecaprenyl-diphosphatase
VEILYSVLQGIVQGLTEFLPVSSSGHLALFEHALEVSPRLYLTTALHLGTLAVVVFHYRKEIFRMVVEVWTVPRRLRQGRRIGELLATRSDLNQVFCVCVACLPTAVLGLAIARWWTQVAGKLWVVSALLLVTAALLWATRSVQNEAQRPLDWRLALLVGVAQGAAALPGISRSGATIAVALLLGVSRSEAARFSFLISIPAILGAGLLEAGALADLSGAQLPPVVLGTAVSAAVGYGALRVLLHWVDQGRLHLFSPYLLMLGVLGLVLSFV